MLKLEAFYEKETATLSYLVWDTHSKSAAVIDSVMDFDSTNLRTSWKSVERIEEKINSNNLDLLWSLETHIHADHFTGAHFFKRKLGTKTVISKKIIQVQKQFFDLLDIVPSKEDHFFDVLVQDGDELEMGDLSIKCIETPGHTPDGLCYQIGGAVFTGDTLFMPDFGTGRCDFPGGSAEVLYNSIQNRLYSLPNSTKLFVGHDYQPGGRELKFETTVEESKKENKHIRVNTKLEEFMKFRTERDAQLSLPKLMFQSVQINLLGGRLPGEEQKERPYLKIPLNPF